MTTALLTLAAAALAVLIRWRAGPAARIFEFGDPDAPSPRKQGPR